MFETDTVFVLGAGASWHYGYPTSEELVAEVLANTKLLRNYCTNRLKNPINLFQMPEFIAAGLDGRALQLNDTAEIIKAWGNQIAECDDLIRRVKDAHPPVIDYFLGVSSKSIQELGRLMIGAVILQREADGAGNAQYKRPETSGPATGIKVNWIRYITEQLARGCNASGDLLENNVNFITFNYDQSLERIIGKSLRAIDRFEEKDIVAFLQPDRVMHFYGALHSQNVSTSEYDALSNKIRNLDTIHTANGLVDKWQRAAKDLQTINPKTGELCKAAARNLLRQARRVYFLGFGFDDINVGHLGLPNVFDATKSKQEIFFTNYCNVMAINKRVAAALEMDEFRKPETRWHDNGKWTLEKSVKDTYSAIEHDFGTL